MVRFNLTQVLANLWVKNYKNGWINRITKYMEENKLNENVNINLQNKINSTFRKISLIISLILSSLLLIYVLLIIFIV